MNEAYKGWLIELKSKIRSSQIKASLAVNTVLIEFYWDLGHSIAEKEFIWGSKLIETLSHELKNKFPDIQGFSTTNLKYCKRFYQFYKLEISQQLVDQSQNIEGNISEYELTKLFPEELKSSLPSIEEIENELRNHDV